MKAGDVVEGFVKGGRDSSDVVPLLPGKESVGKDFSLGQLAKKHKIKLNEDTLILEKKARYCTHLCKVDTKLYGLPQTRQRKVRKSIRFEKNITSYLLFNLTNNPLIKYIRRMYSIFLFGELMTPMMISANTFRRF